MKATFTFGKINYNGTGKRYPAEVTLELRTRGGEDTFTYQNGKRVYTGHKTPEYVELAICGMIWNTKKTDCVSCGQNLDTMYKYLKHNSLFMDLYRMWKQYHLNGAHAGTPEQEKIVNEHFASTGKRYDYTEACEVLKAANMYEVVYSGLTVGRRYENEVYRYGSAWIINELPGEVLTHAEYLIDCANNRKQ